MNYRIGTIATFRKEAKRLGKKYPSLKSDLAALGQSLSENPTQGTPLGNHCYKIRLAIASKNKGKSGGARVITYFVSEDGMVYLLSIYDKSDQDSISNEEIQTLIQSIEED
jgi:mRNA-degrading endonuclease RelE of RelBE toxin-antitoxin system